jgi:tetratricopeptide (TPR) repeat protein
MSSKVEEPTKVAPIEENEQGLVLPTSTFDDAMPTNTIKPQAPTCSKPQEQVATKHKYFCLGVSLILGIEGLLCASLRKTTSAPALDTFPGTCVEKDNTDPARTLMLKRVSQLESQLVPEKSYFTWLSQEKPVSTERERKEAIHLRVRLGDMAWALHKRTCAEAHYRRALALEKEQPSEKHAYSEQVVHAQLRVGILQYEQGLLVDSKRTLEEMLSEMQLTSENRPPVLHQLANTLRDLGDVDAAVLLYQQASREQQAPNPVLQVDMGQGLVLQGKMEEAASLINNAFLLAEQRLRKEGAVRMANEEQVMDDDTSDLFTQLGAAFSLIGRTSDAKKALQTALQIQRRGGGHQRDPAAVGETLRLLARVHRDEGEHAEAMKVVENALKLHDNFLQRKEREEYHVEELAAVHIAAADIVREAGNLTRAQWLAERALQLVETSPNPKSAVKVSAHKVLGQVAHDLGLLDIAGEHYEEALELLAENGNPLELADSHNLLGTVLQDSNKLTAASGHYRLALKYQKQGRGEASVDAMAVTNNLATVLIRVGEACKSGELDQERCQPARRHVVEAVQLFEYAEGLGGQASLPEQNPEFQAIKENLDIAREVLQNFGQESLKTL